MAGIFSFKCSCCGGVHEGSPSFAFSAPSSYLQQSDDVKENGGLETDLCYYSDEDGEHYFIRTVLEIPILGASEPFLWGVWASLSKENFQHYYEYWDTPIIGHEYFGWLCNYLPHYESTYVLAADVVTRENGDRPFLRLHEVDHELFHDLQHGISIEKAQKIAELCMHG